MFIELTDQLRCPADHPEAFLVLIPDQIENRMVLRGVLGCPVCHREYPIHGGVARFGTVPRLARPAASSPPSAEALAAFLGLAGPGGYAVLVGGASQVAEPLTALLPGVHLVAVNPPEPVSESAQISVLEGDSIPVKSRSMRGVVLGPGFGEDSNWQLDAGRAVLPGRRVVGTGAAPEAAGLSLLAGAEGWWVAERR